MKGKLILAILAILAFVIAATVPTEAVAMFADSPLPTYTTPGGTWDTAYTIPSIPYATFIDPAFSETYGYGEVWYKYTYVGEAGHILLASFPVAPRDSVGMQDAHVTVYGDSPLSSEPICSWSPDCHFTPSPGTEYYFQLNGESFAHHEANQVEFVLQDLGPLPKMVLSLNPTGSVQPPGAKATVGGTLNCNTPMVAQLNLQLQQRAGRVIVSASAQQSVPCDGMTPWQVNLSATNALFAAGQADLQVSASGSPDGHYFASDSKIMTIKLLGGKR